MKIKGYYCLFFILSVWFSQALALDLSYQGDIPAANRPSEEYPKKTFSLDSSDYENWNMEKLAKGNTLAGKQERKLHKYDDKFEKKRLGLPHDWYAQYSEDYPVCNSKTLDRRCRALVCNRNILDQRCKDFGMQAQAKRFQAESQTSLSYPH
ncbi:hypothetical protein [Xenorhabdus sp. TH1]|uniref:hypothetical protein n=1 Tax=Xenorhabdus sp. TH1 TaxID=3130166 RepID=UPI0030CFBE7E